MEQVGGGKSTKTTEVRPGKEPGQSRAEYVRYKNAEGKTIRTYKDTYDRAGKFQHRKPLRGGPEAKAPMRTQSLHSFLSDNSSAESLAEEIHDEVRAYKAAAEVKGSSMPVNMTGYQNIHINIDEVVRLCDGYLSGVLTSWDVQYVCDALQMSERVTFHDEAVRDALDMLGEVELNGELTREEVRLLKNRLLQVSQ